MMSLDRKIGEIISASVLNGLEAKLELDNPEDLKVGYPIIVNGERYDFYCLVHDILNKPMEIAERLAGSKAREDILPIKLHESYGGKVFYSKAKLRPIQLIERASGELCEPETIPPYFSQARHAKKEDVERIYQNTKTSVPVGTLRGIPEFWVNIDFEKLVEKPFGIFGRTGVGKSILNKLVCNSILSKDLGTVLIFDMQDEYGTYSKTDHTYGLKYFYPEKVEIFSLDPKNVESKTFIIDPQEIAPSDIIVAFQRDLSPNMIDAIYEINKDKGNRDLISAIRESDPTQYNEQIIHPTVLNALKRRIARFDRFDFIKEVTKGRDAFNQIVSLIKARKSVVLSFGRFGTEPTTYLFVANLLTRRLYDLYTEHNEEYPRLILFLEEAHKFLEKSMAQHTIFDKLARETRKFNLILALIDQRPSGIDEDIRSQLANRLILSLKEHSDISSALVGIPDRAVWENILGTIPPRTVMVIGDAIRVPTVIEVMNYNAVNVKEKIIGSKLTSEELETLAKRSDKFF